MGDNNEENKVEVTEDTNVENKASENETSSTEENNEESAATVALDAPTGIALDTSNDKTDDTPVDKPDEKPTDTALDSPHVDTAAFESEKKKKGIGKIIAISVAGVLVAGYLVMAVLAYLFYYPMTTINNIEGSFKDEEYINDIIVSPYNDYQIKVYFRDGEAVVKGKDIGLVCSAMDDLTAIKKSQNPFLWPTFFTQKEYTAEVKVTYDEAKLDAALSKIKNLNPENMIAPQEPYIDIVDGEAVATLGDPGTTLDVEAFKKLLIEDITKLNEKCHADSEEAMLYSVAEHDLSYEKLTSAVNRINNYLASNITYIYGEYEIPITKEDIISMVQMDDDYNVTFKKSDVESFLKEFSKQHDTLETERKFRTHRGDYLNIMGKKYGWMMDVENEVEALYIDIVNGRTVKREPEFLQTGYYYKNGDDIGKNYVEVDLTNQHLYVYVDGQMEFESDFVSGCVNQGHRTPGGVYSISYKAMNVVLTGRDYASPVTYWMPFNGGIGFHDASWRSSFGGSIYINNGSHGCVNLPIQSARRVYEYVEKGMPVVCYWREDYELQQ